MECRDLEKPEDEKVAFLNQKLNQTFVICFNDIDFEVREHKLC